MKSIKAFLGLSCMIIFLFFGVVLNSNPALAADKTVCESGCTWDNIQDAIDDAFDDDPPGGTVTVTDDRIYDELVRMKDGVNLISSHIDKAHIRRSSGSGKEEVVGFSGAMTCDLIGFEITNPGSGPGIFMNGSGAGITATVENCDIHDSQSAAGIRLNGVISATIIGCNIYSNEWAGIATSKNQKDKLVSDSSVTIEDNLIYQNGTKSDGTAGIFLKGDSGNTVDVEIRGTGTGETKRSRINDNPQAGIRLEDIYGAVTIDNNEVKNNSQAGICIIDVGSGSSTATIQNNDIHLNTKAGITVAGASYLTIGTNNHIHENDFAGVAFRKASIVEFNNDTINVSSQPVSITGNDIYSNTYAGIGIIDAITGTVTITDQNDIYQNIRGGIGIQNDCTVVITENTIRDNIRGGIHTGTDVVDPGGFSGTAGSAHLTIKQNKVYGNGDSGYGGGIDVRHASGTIYNNLVYDNHRGGIRFGGYITEIVNNTVAHNGNATDDMGGGIIYDEIGAGVTAISWLSDSAGPKYGADFQYDNTPGGGDTATWTPNVPELGNYSVYAWWTADTDRATDAPYTINYNNGSATVDVNQQVNGGFWNLLGTYEFAAGSSGSVELADDANGVVIADAIKLELATPGIIVDNDDPDAVNDLPQGAPQAPLLIKNNICAYNQKAGISACFNMTEGSEERDYNLLYANRPWNDVQSRSNDPACNYPNLDVSCTNQQYGGCGIDPDLWPPVKELDSKNDIMADPLFVSITEGSEDYHLQSTEDGYSQNSPAIDAGTYGNDVDLPPGEGTLAPDMGAYGGPLGINW